MIDGAPEVVGFSVNVHEHLIEVPAPQTKAAHSAHSLTTNVGGKHRPEPVPPEPVRLMSNINAALEQQILDIP
ncbi:hypothetical protein SPAN111604_12980 [Sphingomonas antarctica]